MFVIRKFYIIAVLLVLSSFLSGCSGTDKVISLIEDEEYQEAFEAYVNELKKGNIEDEITFEQNIHSQVIKNIDNLKKEKKYKAILSQVEDLKNFEFLKSYIEELEYEIPIVQASYLSYLQGKELYETGEILPAFEEWKNISPDDKENYEETSALMLDFYLNMSNEFLYKNNGPVHLDDLILIVNELPILLEKYERNSETNKLIKKFIDLLIKESIYYAKNDDMQTALSLYHQVDKYMTEELMEMYSDLNKDDIEGYYQFFSSNSELQVLDKEILKAKISGSDSGRSGFGYFGANVEYDLSTDNMKLTYIIETGRAYWTGVEWMSIGTQTGNVPEFWDHFNHNTTVENGFMGGQDRTDTFTTTEIAGLRSLHRALNSSLNSFEVGVTQSQETKWIVFNASDMNGESLERMKSVINYIVNRYDLLEGEFFPEVASEISNDYIPIIQLTDNEANLTPYSKFTRVISEETKVGEINLGVGEWYSGELKNKKMFGKGEGTISASRFLEQSHWLVEYWKASLYEGNLLDGLPDGFGTLYNEEGYIIYEGNWKNGLFNGEGRRSSRFLVSEGTFMNGKLDSGDLIIYIVNDNHMSTDEFIDRELKYTNSFYDTPFYKIFEGTWSSDKLIADGQFFVEAFDDNTLVSLIAMDGKIKLKEEDVSNSLVDGLIANEVLSSYDTGVVTDSLMDGMKYYSRHDRSSEKIQVSIVQNGELIDSGEVDAESIY